MNKKSNSTKKQIEAPKKKLTYMEAKAAFNFRMATKSQGLEERIADDLWKWIHEDEDGIKATDIYSFFISYGITRSLWQQICARNEYVSEMNDTVRLLLGIRSKELAMEATNSNKTRILERTLPLYHPDWKEAEEIEHNRRKELKLVEKNDDYRPVNVFVGRDVPETDIVTKALEDGKNRPE